MAEFEVTQSGSSLRVAVGDEIVVRVPEIPTTGYAWTIATIDPALRLVESSFVPRGEVVIGGDSVSGNGDRPAVGTGGDRVIRLRAASSGEASAELALKRPWESTPTERFSLHATVA